MDRIEKQLVQPVWFRRMPEFAQSRLIRNGYETDARPVSLDMLIQYAREFHVSTDYLPGLDTDPVIRVAGLTESRIQAPTRPVNEFYAANRDETQP